MHEQLFVDSNFVQYSHHMLIACKAPVHFASEVITALYVGENKNKAKVN